jgi:hypothetical protein
MSTVCVDVEFRLSLRPLLVNVAIPYLHNQGCIVRTCLLHSVVRPSHMLNPVHIFTVWYVMHNYNKLHIIT